MLTSLAAALVLSCAPAYSRPPPPPFTTACEGSDQVTRNHDGLEISRAPNACTTVRCEGADRVRRTYDGSQVARVSNACTISRCVGWDFVVRTNDGEVSRVTSARRCLPPTVYPTYSTPQTDPLRYGLSYR